MRFPLLFHVNDILHRRKGKTPINHARINRKKLAEQQRLNRLDQQIKEEGV